MFAEHVWAESHLIGQAKVFFEGSEFFLSDHFGVMAYVDVVDVYGSKAKQDRVAAQSRRSQLVRLRDELQQKELVEVRAMVQEGREERALARQRAMERDRKAYQHAQRRGARSRRERQLRLREDSFGAGSLFADQVISIPARTAVPCAPHDIAIPGLDSLGRSSWDTTKDVPLRGMMRKDGENNCYVISAAQILSLIHI